MAYILATTIDNKVVVMERYDFQRNHDNLQYIAAFNSKGEAFRFSLEFL